MPSETLALSILMFCHPLCAGSLPHGSKMAAVAPPVMISDHCIQGRKKRSQGGKSFPETSRQFFPSSLLATWVPWLCLAAREAGNIPCVPCLWEGMNSSCTHGGDVSEEAEVAGLEGEVELP